MSQFQTKQKVLYIPTHAFGDTKHPDVETGYVSSTNKKFVFVKFEPQLTNFGWDGTTSQACDPKDLKPI